MTRRVMTNVEKPEGTRAPMGQFVRARTYPSAQFRDVTAPNADTLYTTAWFDVSKSRGSSACRHEGPLLPAADARRLTDVFQVPASAHRHQGADLRHHRPGLERRVAQGRDRVQVATGLVWLLGRIYSTGTPQDYKECTRSRTRSRPCRCRTGQGLHARAGQVDPSIDMKTAVRAQSTRSTPTPTSSCWPS